jgi:hypothetical protein
LNLRQNAVGDEGAIAMLQGVARSALRELYLGLNGITSVGVAGGVEALCASGASGKLRTFDLQVCCCVVCVLSPETYYSPPLSMTMRQ